jgi:WD40 repeat protein
MARVLGLTLKNKSPLWPPQRVPVAPARYVSPKRRALAGAAAAAVALSAYVAWSLYMGPAPVLAFRVDDGKSYPYFDPTGSSAAVIGYYSTQPGLYSIRTGERLARFGTHEEIIVRAAFSADGKRMVTAGIDLMLRVWDLSDDRQLRSFDHGGNRVSACALAVSPDGRYAAYALMDSYAPATTANPVTTLFDLDRGTVCFTLAGKGSLPMSLAFSDDGSKLLSIDLDGNAFFHDVATGAQIATAKPASYVGGGCLPPDGNTVFLAGRELWSWDLTTGALKRMCNLPHLCRCVAVSPDGKRLLTGGEDAVRLWSVATGKELAHYRRRSGPITQLAFSPDGTLAISADAGGSVQAWQLP